MQGDRISVESGARVEIALADRNIVRLAGDSALQLARVAFSADRDDRTTRLDLDEGEAVLAVTEQALGDDLPEMRTPGGTVYIHQPGFYRIRADAGGGVELVVREGYAELLTDSGSTVVRAGEAAWTTGDRWRPVEVGAAGSRSELERWGETLDQRAQVAATRTIHVEPELAYAAEPLDDYGSWVYVDASWYWRPRVAAGWRPYWQGRWGWTPSGLTWISSEPWGWLPYHYGSWTMLPGYGWGWRPGRVYSPAWVYWYIGSGWSGWCPVGYYTDYYRSRWAGGFRFGVYGWAGGSWGLYGDWNFLPTSRLCARDAGNWRRRGHDLARTEGPVAPRGILTTDTRDLPRDRWDRPDELVRRLERSPRGGRADGELPEVTDFVARRRDLPADVARAVTRTPADPSPRRATPLDPEMERRPRREDPVAGAGWRARVVDTPGVATGRNAPGRTASGTVRRDPPQTGRSERFDPNANARQWPGNDRPGTVQTPPRIGQPPARTGQPEPRVELPGSGDRQGWKLRGGWSDRTTIRPGDAGLPAAADRSRRRSAGAPRRRRRAASGSRRRVAARRPLRAARSRPGQRPQWRTAPLSRGEAGRRRSATLLAGWRASLGPAPDRRLARQYGRPLDDSSAAGDATALGSPGRSAGLESAPRASAGHAADQRAAAGNETGRADRESAAAVGTGGQPRESFASQQPAAAPSQLPRPQRRARARLSRSGCTGCGRIRSPCVSTPSSGRSFSSTASRRASSSSWRPGPTPGTASRSSCRSRCCAACSGRCGSAA